MKEKKQPRTFAGKLARWLVAVSFALALVLCVAEGGQTKTAQATVIQEGDFGENNALHWHLKLGTLTISGTGAIPYAIRPWKEYADEVTNIFIEEGITSIEAYALTGHANLDEVTIPASVTEIDGLAFSSCKTPTTVNVPCSWKASPLYDFGNANHVYFHDNSKGTFYVEHSETQFAKKCASCGEQLAIVNKSSEPGITAVAVKEVVIADVEYNEEGEYKFDVTVTFEGADVAEDEYETIVTYSSADNAAGSDVTATVTVLLKKQGCYLTSNTCQTSFHTKPISGEYESWTWTISGKKNDYTLTISGTGVIDSNPWRRSVYSHQITALCIEEGITGIGESLFQYYEELTEVSIPNTVTTIESYAFMGCAYLTGITIPGSVTSIGNGVFNECTMLETVTIEEGVTSIPQEMFYGCTEISSITIPDSVTSIGDLAFAYCSNLTEVHVPNNLKKIGLNAFVNSALDIVTLPCTWENAEWKSTFDSVERKNIYHASQEYDYTVNAEDSGKLDKKHACCGELIETIDIAESGMTGLTASVTIADVAHSPSGVYNFDTAVSFLNSNSESVTLTEGTDYTVIVTYNEADNEIAKEIAATATIRLTNTGYYLTDADVETSFTTGAVSGILGRVEWSITGKPGAYTLVIDGSGALNDFEGGEPWSGYENGIAYITIGNEISPYAGSCFENFTALTAVDLPCSWEGKNVPQVFAGKAEYREHVSRYFSSSNLGNENYIKELCEIFRCSEELGKVTLLCEDADYTGEAYAAVVTGTGTLEETARTLPVVYEKKNGSSWEPVSEAKEDGIYRASVSLGEGEAKKTVYAEFLIGNPSGSCGTNVTWSFNRNTGALTISGTGAMDNLNNKQPWYSFKNSITSVSIGDGVTNIGAYAFISCSNLSSVSGMSTVTEIETSAFYGCYSLTELALPETLSVLSKDACKNTGITSVSLPCRWKETDMTSYFPSGATITVSDHSSSSLTASNNVITDSCDACDTVLGTVTVICEGGDYEYVYDETYGRYEGVPYEATVTKTGTLENTFVFPPSYQKKVDGEWQDWWPDEGGTYRASITLEKGGNEVTAFVEFTINKTELPEDITKPEIPSNVTYKHGRAFPVPCRYMLNDGFEYFYSFSEDGTNWSDWSTEGPTLTNGGDSLQVKVKMVSANFNDWISEAVTVTMLPYEFGVTESDLWMSISDVYYIGTGQKPDFEIHYGGNERLELTENVKNGVGCTLTYENNVNVSTEDSKAKIIITGDGINYKGTLTGEFEILQYDITEVATTNSGVDAEGNPIWVNSAMLTAPEGFLIGMEPDGEFSSWTTLYESSATTAGTEITYYLKQVETGYLSVPKTMTVYMDVSGPTMSGLTINLTSATAEFSWILTDNMTSVAECRYLFVPAEEAGNVTTEDLKNGTLVSGTDGFYTIRLENLTTGAEYALCVFFMDNAGNYSCSALYGVIIPKAGYTTDTIEKTYYHARENEDDFDVYEYVPIDDGWVDFEIEGLQEGALFVEEPSVDEDGLVNYTVKAGAVGDAARFQVVIYTDTYEPIYVPVIVTLIDKQPVTLAEGSAVTVTNSITEGAPVSDLTFAKAVFVDEAGNEVPGTLSWKNGSETPAAGKKVLTWVFTPAEEAYAVLEGMIEVTVAAKPESTVTPTAKPTATPIAKPTAKPSVTPTAKPTAAPISTVTPTEAPVPGTTTVATSGEKIVNAEGEEILSVVQEPGTTNKLVIPGLTDVTSEDGKKPTLVVWESSNPDAVEVDEEGNITMKEPGLAEIMVTVGEGENAKKETIVILVEEPRKYVNPAEEAFKDVRLGTSWSDIPLIRYQKLNSVVDINFWGVKNWQQETYQYVWTVSDETVAKVDTKGRVTALRPGVIKLSLGLKNKINGNLLNVQTIEIVVPQNYEDKILLGTSKDNTFDKLRLRLNERIDLNFYGVKNWKKEDYEYRWVSSEPTVVWVDKFGRLVPVNPGKADIFLVLIEKKTGYARYVAPVTVIVPEK